MKVTFLKGAALLALAGSFAIPALAADSGADIYKAKCAMCHGPDGAGKMGPKLKGTTLTAAQIEDQLLKGAPTKKAPHNKPISGMTEDQAKAVATYVTSLK